MKFYRIKDNWFSGHSFDLRQNVFATSKIDFIVSIAEGDHVVVERLLLADALGIRTANDVLLRDPMHRNDVVHDAWTTWQRPNYALDIQRALCAWRDDAGRIRGAPTST